MEATKSEHVADDLILGQNVNPKVEIMRASQVSHRSRGPPARTKKVISEACRRHVQHEGPSKHPGNASCRRYQVSHVCAVYQRQKYLVVVRNMRTRGLNTYQASHIPKVGNQRKMPSFRVELQLHGLSNNLPADGELPKKNAL